LTLTLTLTLTLLAIGIGEAMENCIQPAHHRHQGIAKFIHPIYGRARGTTKATTAAKTSASVECRARKCEPAIWRSVCTVGEAGT